ncbi:MAG: TetR/AcrR family transcriptional regulator [Lachnospiraceae bacterium]|nr:TetR/AcrR family transcriptional regulator [Lachnospiraceae bacterium]
MPRDKTLSHIKVNKAIKEEFLKKGFEAASIRSIGARAGMTSAGLYRHYSDKESMFNALVEPLIDDMKQWTKRHTDRKYLLLDESADKKEIIGESFIDLIREVILPKRDEFKLLMTCSRGTKYENFIHDYALLSQKELLKALSYMKKKGCPVKDIDEDELHMLLSAYLTACFEPVIHDCKEEKIEKYLNTIQDFFMPGWLRIMGLN